MSKAITKSAPKAAPKSDDDVSANFARGALTIELGQLSAATDTKPMRVKIAPRGRIETRDGRAYEFTPEILVQRFAADGIEIPVDLNHQISASIFGGDAGAIGWIKSLTSEPDGLYGEVDWLDAGRQALGARTHRYLSPTFRHDEFGKATWLHSVALVAAPALSMPALAAASLTTETRSMKAIATALGLSTDANEDACLAALAALSTSKVDKAVHDEALARLAAVNSELSALQKTARDEKVAALLSAALTAKKILPAQKDHYAKLCATDDGFAQVAELLDITPEKLGASSLSLQPASPPEPTATAVDPVNLAAEARGYQASLKAKGVNIPFDQAVAAVQAQATSSAKTA
ncbi:phage I-like protein [Hoeflea marina]|uniref:Phage I-like protein n=1 Tax=Hoeflea marina TaxID=274592 RepID=A0A317PF25_9HYPH|nr:phage protease [Hoeflea marina]PWV97716.1 phage I-like protein [Hoeflea marina]